MSKNSFQRALDYAHKRLTKAQAEREVAQRKLGALDREIPDLQRTIHALSQQLKPAQLVHLSEVVAYKTDDPTLARARATLDMPQDLTGMGSIPAGSITVEEPVLTEEDLLPEPEGQPVLPEK